MRSQNQRVKIVSNLQSQTTSKTSFWGSEHEVLTPVPPEPSDCIHLFVLMLQYDCSEGVYFYPVVLNTLAFYNEVVVPMISSVLVFVDDGDRR